MATHAGAPDKPPPPPSNQLQPERFAERTLVLLDGAEGLLARCHRLDRTMRSNDKCRAVREPEWKGLRSKLAKAFPTLPDLTKDAKLESFRARATETAAELRHGYELFVDLEAHLAVHLTTLRAMLGQLRHYSLDEGRETTRSVLRLFNAYTRLLKFASTIPDRKALVALYACALKASARPLPGNYEPVAKKLLPRLDDCWRFCVEAFKEHVATLSTLVAQQLELVQLHSEGAQSLVRRSALTLLEDASGLQKPSEAPLDTKHKGRRDCRTLHGELLEARLGCDFAILATLACPGVVFDAQGLALLVAKMACEDALVMQLYRSSTINVHSELEALGKWFPPRNYPLQRRDVKLAKLAKEWSKNAVLHSGLKHRERRAYLLGELDVAQGLLVAVPGLSTAKAPLVLACCAARDEVAVGFTS